MDNLITATLKYNLFYFGNRGDVFIINPATDIVVSDNQVFFMIPMEGKNERGHILPHNFELSDTKLQS